MHAIFPLPHVPRAVFAALGQRRGKTSAQMVPASDDGCARAISLLPVYTAGFGHRFGMLMFGIDLAERTRSKLVLSDDFWSGKLSSKLPNRLSN